VIVWLWQAGSTQGVVVTGNQAKARRRVASCMRDTGAVTAVLEMAYFDGMKSLNATYAPVDGQRWLGRCHPSGRVSWRLRAPERESAAVGRGQPDHGDHSG
jgi:hypothetical protein